MWKFNLAVVGALAFGAGLIADSNTSAKAQPARVKPVPAVAHARATLPLDAQTALVKQYCAVCHSEKGHAGGLSLASFDPGQVDQNAETVEMMWVDRRWRERWRRLPSAGHYDRYES